MRLAPTFVPFLFSCGDQNSTAPDAKLNDSYLGYKQKNQTTENKDGKTIATASVLDAHEPGATWRQGLRPASRLTFNCWVRPNLYLTGPLSYVSGRSYCAQRPASIYSTRPPTGSGFWRCTTRWQTSREKRSAPPSGSLFRFSSCQSGAKPPQAQD